MFYSGVMFDKRIPTGVKGKIHPTVIQPAMLYGLETVPQRKKTTRRLEVAEMKMCIWACGMTRIERLRNEDIRQSMHVINIAVRCRRARLRWFGHVKRIEENYVERRMLSMVSPRMRGRGARGNVGWTPSTLTCGLLVRGRRTEWKRHLKGIYICRSDPIPKGRSLKKKAYPLKYSSHAHTVPLL